MIGSDLCLSTRMGTRISNCRALSIFIISDCSLFVFDALFLPVFHPLHYILQLCSQYKQLFYSIQKKTACIRNTPAASPSILLYAFLVYPDAAAPFGITHDCAKPSLMPYWPFSICSGCTKSSLQHLKPWLRSTFLCFRLGTETTWLGLVSHVLLNLILTWTALL